MKQDISIIISDGDLTRTISFESNDNLPYNMADVIKEVVHITSANPEIIIEELVDEYGLPDIVKDRSSKNEEYVTWHRADIAPKVDKAVYVKFEDNSKAPWVINNIISEEDWVSFVGTHGAKEWCYLTEILKEGYKI